METNFVTKFATMADPTLIRHTDIPKQLYRCETSD